METEAENRCEDREAKLQTLQALLNASIAAGGHNTDDDLTRMLDAKAMELAKTVTRPSHD
jgi:antitoxin ParD1/3/4